MSLDEAPDRRAFLRGLGLSGLAVAAAATLDPWGQAAKAGDLRLLDALQAASYRPLSHGAFYIEANRRGLSPQAVDEKLRTFSQPFSQAPVQAVGRQFVYVLDRAQAGEVSSMWGASNATGSQKRLMWEWLLYEDVPLEYTEDSQTKLMSARVGIGLRVFTDLVSTEFVRSMNISALVATATAQATAYSAEGEVIGIPATAVGPPISGALNVDTLAEMLVKVARIQDYCKADGLVHPQVVGLTALPSLTDRELMRDAVFQTAALVGIKKGQSVDQWYRGLPEDAREIAVGRALYARFPTDGQGRPTRVAQQLAEEILDRWAGKFG